jgi:hypothetical protein
MIVELPNEVAMMVANMIPPAADFMRRLLPLWAVGCQLVALTASLSPSQEIDLKIAMSAKFTIVRMSTVRPSIGYAVDEVEDVDEEIIRQIVEWDCDVSSEADRAIVTHSQVTG